MNLLWTILAPFAAALLVFLAPPRFAKWLALAACALAMAAAANACLVRLQDFDAALWSFDRNWIEAFGIRFHLEADGISLVLILLTGIVAVAGVLCSWNVEKRQRAFFAFYLVIIGASSGVFLSRDAFLLFAFYEMVIVPKYFLIAIWGSEDREYGAMKLTMYSIAGSALVLLGLAVAFGASGTGSFDLLDLASVQYPPALQTWLFPVMFLGFAVLAGMWPLHTWAPTGHVAAPTAASMLLAGIVMKLGAYGALRVAMPLFPEGFALWRGVIAGLALVGIVYAAFVALGRRDLKFVIGYSSVSHMGFVLLGLAMANLWGLRGAVLQMVSHGLIAGLLFAVVGRLLYDRTHNRDLDALGGFDLGRTLPGAAVVFTLACAASMGLPGFSGFAAELSVILGVWQSDPWLLAPLAAGILATGAFTLRALQRSFFLKPASDAPPPDALPPLTPAEIAGVLLLLAGTLAIGLYPGPWMALIDDGLGSPLFDALLGGPLP